MLSSIIQLVYLAKYFKWCWKIQWVIKQRLTRLDNADTDAVILLNPGETGLVWQFVNRTVSSKISCSLKHFVFPQYWDWIRWGIHFSQSINQLSSLIKPYVGKGHLESSWNTFVLFPNGGKSLVCHARETEEEKNSWKKASVIEKWVAIKAFHTLAIKNRHKIIAHAAAIFLNWMLDWLYKPVLLKGGKRELALCFLIYLRNSTHKG